MTGTVQAEDKQSEVVGTDAVVQEELVRVLGNSVLKGWGGRAGRWKESQRSDLGGQEAS